MSIDGGQRGKIAPGTRLTAKYKGAEYGATFVAAEDGDRFRLDDGQEFNSLSAAGAAVMGGIACNGWRFWSIAPTLATEAPPKDSGRSRAAR